MQGFLHLTLLQGHIAFCGAQPDPGACRPFVYSSHAMQVGSENRLAKEDGRRRAMRLAAAAPPRGRARGNRLKSRQRYWSSTEKFSPQEAAVSGHRGTKIKGGILLPSRSSACAAAPSALTHTVPCVRTHQHARQTGGSTQTFIRDPVLLDAGSMRNAGDPEPRLGS